jgi:hypothetical protein
MTRIMNEKKNKENNMKKRYLMTSVVVLVFVVFAIMSSSPAHAVAPAGKSYVSFVELNPGGMGGFLLGDCIWFTNSRVCSAAFGKCWGYTLGELDGTVQSWSATLGNMPFLGFLYGGYPGNVKVELSGLVETRGPGSVSNAVGLITQPAVARGSLTIDGHEVPGCFARPGESNRMLSHVGQFFESKPSATSLDRSSR